jgi:hypothetical protein
MDDMNHLLRSLGKDSNTLRSIMNSADGQTLMRMLAGQDGGTSLRQAAQSAMQGDTAQMSRMIQNLMNTPDGAKLAERIRQAVEK